MTIKAHIRVYLNEGHDVETASQMVDALQSSQGVPGVKRKRTGKSSKGQKKATVGNIT